MVGGGGASDRDNGTLFPPIRRHLVEAWIAVLSYDKRGVGESSGDWRDATMDDLAADTVAALGKPSVTAYWADVDERLWEFLKRKQDHDPVPDALRLRCPYLATFGDGTSLYPSPKASGCPALRPVTPTAIAGRQ